MPTFGSFADLSKYQRAAAQPTENPLDSLISGFSQGNQLSRLPQTLQEQRDLQALNQLQKQLAVATAQQRLADLQNPDAALARQVQEQLTLKGALNPDLGISAAPSGLVGETIQQPGALTPEQTQSLTMGQIAQDAGGVPLVQPTVAAGPDITPIALGNIQTGLNFNRAVPKAAESQKNADELNKLIQQETAKAKFAPNSFHPLGIDSGDVVGTDKSGNVLRKAIPPNAAGGTNIGGLPGKATEGVSPSEVDPNELKGALNYYKQTGSLPAFGMGKSGLRSAFYAALGGEEVDSINKGLQNKAVRDGMKKAYATQQNQYQATATSIKTLDKQLDLASDLSKKVDRYGSPLVNKYLLYLKGSVEGDADTQMFENAVATSANEFSKILSGSAASIAGSTVSSAAEAHKLINTAFSNGTFNQVVDLMKKEGKFRLSSQKDTIDQLKTDLGDVGKESAPQAEQKIKIVAPNGTVGYWPSNKELPKGFKLSQ